MTKLVEDISTCLVCGTNRRSNAPMSRIELTPWDLQLLSLDYFQVGLLFKKPITAHHDQNTTGIINGYHHNNTLVHHLQNSLSRTLDFFPPLTGRLSTTVMDNSSNQILECFFIHCNDEGALFTHAIAHGVKVSNILEPEHVPTGILDSFFSLNGVHNYEGISKPLLGVQVTELDDGYFIACSFNHAVVDGTSLWHFINSWSEISRGMDSPLKLPRFTRWFPAGIHHPIHINLHQFIEDLEDSDYEPDAALAQIVFHFSKENIAKLKQKASISAPGTYSTSDSSANYNAQQLSARRISSLQAIFALIWQSVVRARCREVCNEDQMFGILTQIGARQRLHQPLPEGYFGNAFHEVEVIATASKLLGPHGLSWAAMQLNQVVAAQTSEATTNFYKNWPKQPRMLKTGEELRNFIVTNNSPRFDAYGNDFGWGKPLAARLGPNNKFDGDITVFPGLEDGSIDVQACLSKQTLSSMEKDKEFMNFVDI